MIITSKDNAQVKALKRLVQQPKRTDATMAVEGIHACQLLMQTRPNTIAIERVWVGSGAIEQSEVQQLLAQAHLQKIPVTELANGIYREVSSVEQGVSLIFEVQRPYLTELPRQLTGNVLLLDGIQDAGNMGSMLRSAAAAGVREVWLNSQCVNPYAVKVIRAGVGAHFGLNIREHIDFNRAIELLNQQKIYLCATSSHGSHSIYDANLCRPMAWLMGSEGAGVREELLNLADELLSIPMAAGESLNVAAAAAVCLFEMVRQQG